VDRLALAFEEAKMILRIWRGAVRAEDADHYLQHQADTGIQDYRATAGNLGALVLSRARETVTEVVTVSLWTSVEAVKSFAGDDYGRAKYYPGDDEFLVARDDHVDHFEVVSVDLDPRLTSSAD
jgi:heme-degrading monooxygenase HmoA